MIDPILSQSHTDNKGTEDSAEARMRQALGKLGTASPGKLEAPRRMTYQASPGAGRHRFRQDGEVPVVRISLGEGGRVGERRTCTPVGNTGQEDEGRGQEGVERARQMQELTDQLRATQTRLGHAELAASEATRAARAWQEEAGSLRRALDAVEANAAQVRAELVATELAQEELRRSPPAACQLGLQSHAREDTGSRRRAGRPLGSTSRARDQMPAGEPEPVKWWAGD